VVTSLEYGDGVDLQLHKKRFTDSQAEAASIVAEMREDKIEDILDIQTGAYRNQPVKVTGRDPDTNEEMYGEVSPQAFEHALRKVAAMARRDYEFDDLEAAVDHYEDVVWTNAAGHRVSEDEPWISAVDIAGQAGVTSQDFVFYILETTHGHAAQGETAPVGRHKYDLSGNFVQAGPTTMAFEDDDGKEIPVTLIKPR
jgi:hypothetical protein